MSSAGGFFRPGISVLAFCGNAAPDAWLRAALPRFEQVCLMGSTPPKQDSPKIKFVWCAETEPSPRARVRLAGLADHEWTLDLALDEHLTDADVARLRAALPHVGGNCVALQHADTKQWAVRLWRTAWNLASNGAGDVGAAGPSLNRPRHMIRLDGIQPKYRASAAAGKDAARLPTSTWPVPTKGSGPVIVTGVHRSGTSLTARLVSLLGVAWGDDLLGAHTSNPKGHWEDRTALRLNQLMLQQSTAVSSPWEWTQCVSVAPEALAAPMHEHLAQFVAQKQKLGRWGFKDPRTSLTLRAWLRHMPNAQVVVCARSPHAVAASLRKRDQMPSIDGLRLWLQYNQILRDNLELVGRSGLVVDYDRMLAHPRPEIHRLATFLGVEERLDADFWAAVEAFLDPSLRHHDSPSGPRQDADSELASAANAGELDAVARMAAALSQAATAAPTAQATGDVA